MRLFPGAGRRPVVGARPRPVVAVAATVLALAVAAPVAYADGGKHGKGALKHRAHHVHGRITQVSGDLDDASAQVRAVNARLELARTRLHGARASLTAVRAELHSARVTAHRLAVQLDAAQARLEAAVAQVNAAQARVDAQRTATRNTVIGFATQGDPRLAAISSYMESGSSQDLLMSQTGNELIIRQETGTLKALQTAETQLRAQRAKVQTARDEVSARRASAQQTVVRVTRLRTSAVAQRAAVRSLVLRTRRDRVLAVRARRADRSKLRRLRAEESRIKRLILARTAGDGNRSVGNTHGMFIPPVAGTYITSPYGWRRHPIYHYWGLHDGDDLHAPCGTHEVAVGSGKVIEQYYSDVWGHRLYLDLGRINGHSYVAIYNHISAYRSHVGERVARGQTLALAGTTGWSTACHIHFTIMRDGNAVDPAPLIGM